MESGTIVKWLKSEGEQVEKGEALLGPRVAHREADDAGVELERAVEVVDLQLGDESCVHHGSRG